MGEEVWGNRGWEFKMQLSVPHIPLLDGLGVSGCVIQGYLPRMTMLETGKPSFRTDALRSLAFLLGVFAALEIFLWWVIPARQTPLTAAGVIVILVVLIGDPLRRGDTAAAVGLTGRNFGGALRLLILPTMAAAVLIIVTGLLVRDGGNGHRFLKRFVQVLPWALLQQGLLQATFNRRLQRSFGTGFHTAAINGIFFGAMHLPGPALTAGTFLAGTGWSWAYQKKPNLWVLVLSHALLSATAQSFLPAAWTHGFRVGPGYFNWG